MADGQCAKPRILVWGFSNARAGTEAVISNYVKMLSDSCAFDIVSYEPTPNHAALFSGDNELLVVPPKRKNPLGYWRSLEKIVCNGGRGYTALWCNLNSYTNIDILVLAERFGIQRRIIHAHNSRLDGADWIIKLNHRLNEGRAKRLATDLWACSQEAGNFFFSSRDYLVLPNAIDYEEYRYRSEIGQLWKKEHGIPDNAFVMGNIGRISVQKNQKMLVELTAALRKAGINAVCQIAGAGEMKSELEEFSKEAGVGEYVMFLGPIKEIPAFLSSLDVFVFPSLYEGLPVALLEAQANGLPCIVGDGVSREARISSSCLFLPTDDVHSWVEKVSSAKRSNFDSKSVGAGRYSLDEQARKIHRYFNC